MHNWNVKKHFFLLFVLLNSTQQRHPPTDSQCQTKMAIDAVYIWLSQVPIVVPLKASKPIGISCLPSSTRHRLILRLTSSKSAANWNGNNSSAINDERACVNHSRRSFPFFGSISSTRRLIRWEKQRQNSCHTTNCTTLPSISGVRLANAQLRSACWSKLDYMEITRQFYMCFDQFWSSTKHFGWVCLYAKKKLRRLIC